MQPGVGVLGFYGRVQDQGAEVAGGQEHEHDAEDVPPCWIDVDHVLETNNNAHCAAQTNEFEETDWGGGGERGRGWWCERLRDSNRMSFRSCPMIAGGDGDPDMR
jgi:hypothetical protein